MSTAAHQNESLAPKAQATVKAPSIKHRRRSKRFYFDVGLGSVCLSGIDTGGAYCLLEVSLAPGMAGPRHTHTREDEVYVVLAGELEVTIEENTFVLQPGDTLLAPRDIPHKLHNSGSTTNHDLLVFSPSGFEEFIMATPFPRLTTRLLQRNHWQSPFEMSTNSPPSMEFFLVNPWRRAGSF